MEMPYILGLTASPVQNVNYRNMLPEDIDLDYA